MSIQTNSSLKKARSMRIKRTKFIMMISITESLMITMVIKKLDNNKEVKAKL